MKLYDLHVHTGLSSCADPGANITDYCAAAAESGLEIIGFADHAWDKAISGASPWYAPQDYERLSARKAEAEAVTGIKVLLGAEAEMAAGVLAFTGHAASLVDYIICPHSHTHMKGFVLPSDCKTFEKHADYLVKSFYSLCVHPLAKYIFGIAHPMYPVGVGEEELEEIYSHITDAQLEFICAAAAKSGLALELNTSSVSHHSCGGKPNPAYARFFAAAKNAGCDFFLGSDKHKCIPAGEKDVFFDVPQMMEALGLEESDFQNALERAMKL